MPKLDHILSCRDREGKHALTTKTEAKEVGKVFIDSSDENYANVAVTLTSTGITCIFCSNSC